MYPAMPGLARGPGLSIGTLPSFFLLTREGWDSLRPTHRQTLTSVGLSETFPVTWPSSVQVPTKNGKRPSLEVTGLLHSSHRTSSGGKFVGALE